MCVYKYRLIYLYLSFFTHTHIYIYMYIYTLSIIPLSIPLWLFPSPTLSLKPALLKQGDHFPGPAGVVAECLSGHGSPVLGLLFGKGSAGIDG